MVLAKMGCYLLAFVFVREKYVLFKNVSKVCRKHNSTKFLDHVGKQVCVVLMLHISFMNIYMYIKAMAPEQILIQHKKVLQQAMKELSEFE